MKRAIYKYPLPHPWEKPGRFTVSMPYAADVLALQIQRGQPTLWAEVDPSRERVPEAFEWFPTGHHGPWRGDELPMADEPYYVGTLQWHDGNLVFHLYCYGEWREAEPGSEQNP